MLMIKIENNISNNNSDYNNIHNDNKSAGDTNNDTYINNDMRLINSCNHN